MTVTTIDSSSPAILFTPGVKFKELLSEEQLEEVQSHFDVLRECVEAKPMDPDLVISQLNLLEDEIGDFGIDQGAEKALQQEVCRIRTCFAEFIDNQNKADIADSLFQNSEGALKYIEEELEKKVLNAVVKSVAKAYRLILRTLTQQINDYIQTSVRLKTSSKEIRENAAETGKALIEGTVRGLYQSICDKWIIDSTEEAILMSCTKELEKKLLDRKTRLYYEYKNPTPIPYSEEIKTHVSWGEFNKALNSIARGIKKNGDTVTCYISYCRKDQSRPELAHLIGDTLKNAGVDVLIDKDYHGIETTKFTNKIYEADFALVAGTPLYMEEDQGFIITEVKRETPLIREKARRNPGSVIRVLLAGTLFRSFPMELNNSDCLPQSFRSIDDFYKNFFNVLEQIYGTELENNIKKKNFEKIVERFKSRTETALVKKN